MGSGALQKWLIRKGTAVVAALAVNYGLLAIALRDPGAALLVLTGVVSPFETGFPWLSVPLLLAGYLLVPALLGAIAAVVIERQLRQLLIRREDAERIIEDLLDDSDS